MARKKSSAKAKHAARMRYFIRRMIRMQSSRCTYTYDGDRWVGYSSPGLFTVSSAYPSVLLKRVMLCDRETGLWFINSQLLAEFPSITAVITNTPWTWLGVSEDRVMFADADTLSNIKCYGSYMAYVTARLTNYETKPG